MAPEQLRRFLARQGHEVLDQPQLFQYGVEFLDRFDFSAVPQRVRKFLHFLVAGRITLQTGRRNWFHITQNFSPCFQSSCKDSIYIIDIQTKIHRSSA